MLLLLYALYQVMETKQLLHKCIIDDYHPFKGISPHHATWSPSQELSQNPTFSPLQSPSPSNDPSQLPTFSPSNHPTIEPTIQNNAMSMSNRPTIQSSQAPILSDLHHPTIEPTTGTQIPLPASYIPTNNGDLIPSMLHSFLTGIITLGSVISMLY